MTDDNDSKILSLLKNDGRMSFVDIAKQIGLTEGAVRARVSKLIKQGTIRHFTVDTKDDVKAVVSVATSRAMSTTAVADSIRKLGVDRVYEISGNY
ncbi:MAG: winged helix-turn-helix transcriptional regulator, partial [Candidatus Micrarchaeota archaeon]|nr:winged helix-turn-helix transcriptional regulator [Candidatus Micrarchaeota archaeon]